MATQSPAYNLVDKMEAKTVIDTIMCKQLWQEKRGLKITRKTCLILHLKKWKFQITINYSNLENLIKKTWTVLNLKSHNMKMCDEDGDITIHAAVIILSTFYVRKKIT